MINPKKVPASKKTHTYIHIHTPQPCQKIESQLLPSNIFQLVLLGSTSEKVLRKRTTIPYILSFYIVDEYANPIFRRRLLSVYTSHLEFFFRPHFHCLHHNIRLQVVFLTLLAILINSETKYLK
jgi:hypothetical protein